MSYPGAVQTRDFIVVPIVPIWIIDIGTEVLPRDNKNPSGFKLGKLSTALIALNMLRGHGQDFTGLAWNGALSDLFIHVIIHF